MYIDKYIRANIGKLMCGRLANVYHEDVRMICIV